MVKKTMAVLVSVMMMLAMLTACGETADSSVTSTPKAEPAASSAEEQPEETKEEQPEETKQESADEGDLGDYHVKILDIETGLKDWDGKPTVGIKYEFTNNSDDSISFYYATMTYVYQDGVELESTFLETDSEEAENADKNIKSGTTVTCEQYFVATSDESDVEVEVTEYLGFTDEKLEKTFSIKK